MTVWSPVEVRRLYRAVAQAPSVHNTHPWVMELHGRSVQFYERWDVALPRHDPKGRDRLMSCGAAVTNLVLAMRVMGWGTDVQLVPGHTHPDLVATVTAVRRQPPSEAEADWYAAIPYRHSHRDAFAGAPAPEEVQAVRAALLGERVGVRQLSAADADPVAGLLVHTADLLRHDRLYQRELRRWMGVRHIGHVPDHRALADQMAHECVLVVETVDDGRRDHLLAGMAVQRAWLAATHLQLAMSLITQPLQLREVRAGLSERLELPGFPHALVRVGRPARPVAASARGDVGDVVRAKT
ncbi:NAD(P)H nitroreductase [Kibdelosporangium lantanae]